MAKHFKSTDVSSKRCINCGKPMKSNLLFRNPLATHCYTCWMFCIRGKKTKRKWFKAVNDRPAYSVLIHLIDVIKANRIKYKKRR